MVFLEASTHSDHDPLGRGRGRGREEGEERKGKRGRGRGEGEEGKGKRGRGREGEDQKSFLWFSVAGYKNSHRTRTCLSQACAHGL